VLDARRLVKRFFGITAVDDVSFVVRRGEADLDELPSPPTQRFNLHS
jgi:hypothetical protein